MCERGSVRDRGVDVGSIDSRVSLREKAAPSESPRFGVSEIPSAAFCSHLTGALVRPRHRASYLLGVRGSLPCAPVAALLSFVSIHSWSSGLSTLLGLVYLATYCTGTVLGASGSSGENFACE